MAPNNDLSRQRILLTNDDGIDAPGLKLLEDIVSEFCDDVWVVAPNVERSGAGHSISMHTPIRLQQRDARHYAVAGTPTDCVLMAYYEILKDQERPTVLLSGINGGANLAEDLTYSGTIAAAIEGALLGMRSVALSQLRDAAGQPVWAAAAQHAPPLLQALLETPQWRSNSFVNVNFPPVPPADISAARVTTQGQRPPGSFVIEPRIDARNVPYYWVKIDYKAGGTTPGTDLEAIKDNAISVTPPCSSISRTAGGARRSARWSDAAVAPDRAPAGAGPGAVRDMMPYQRRLGNRVSKPRGAQS